VKLYISLALSGISEMSVRQNSSISRPGSELGKFNYSRRSALPFLWARSLLISRYERERHRIY